MMQRNPPNRDLKSGATLPGNKLAHPHLLSLYRPLSRLRLRPRFPLSGLVRCPLFLSPFSFPFSTPSFSLSPPPQIKKRSYGGSTMISFICTRPCIMMGRVTATTIVLISPEHSLPPYPFPPPLTMFHSVLRSPSTPPVATILYHKFLPNVVEEDVGTVWTFRVKNVTFLYSDPTNCGRRLRLLYLQGKDDPEARIFSTFFL